MTPEKQGDESVVHGFALPGFELVREAFGRNFSTRAELGAAFAAVQEGEVILDLWGGLADNNPPRDWQQDTLQVIFSGTKGLVALCLLMLIDRGLMDPDAPVTEYWPEFGQSGKKAVRVSEVASHQARLPGLATRVSEDDVLDPARMAELLAVQAQDGDPRSADAYHALTFGWLCGELVRRVDGRTVGRFFADEVAAPLELEIWIGLPQELEDRVATLGGCPVRRGTS